MSTFPAWTEENNSLLKRHLTKETFEQLKDKQTEATGFTLQKSIQTCVDNQDSGVGIYAGDEEAYSLFAPIFDKVIEEYHGGYTPDKKHPRDMDSSKVKMPADWDDAVMNEHIISTRIRVGRNIRGFGLSPGITTDQRKEVEKLVTTALTKLESDLKGTYYPLTGMSEEVRQNLVDDHFLFKKGDRFLESAGANRDWPASRGIYHNDEKTFLVWVNEEDQMRIISMQQGSDFIKVFDRLVRGIDAVERSVKDTSGKEFMFNDHLGFIHSCPSNLGTGMRASVHVKLPKLSKQANFKEICASLNLQPRGIHGEHTETDTGVYDISNKHRIGYTEVQLLQTMIDGVCELVKQERAL